MLDVLAHFWSAFLGLSIFFLGSEGGAGSSLSPCFALLGVLLLLRRMNQENSLLSAWFSGFLFYVFAIPWVAEAFERFAHLSRPAGYLAMFILFLIQGLEMVFLQLVFRGLRQTFGLLALPLAWFCLETLIPRFLPWYLSAGIFEIPLVRSVIPLFGSAGCSALCILFFSLLFRMRETRRRGDFVLTFTCLFGLLCYGYFWERSESRWVSSQRLSVAVVQGNLQDPVLWTTPSGVEKLRRLTTELLEKKERVDLIVWPESALAQTFRQQESEVVPGTEKDPFPGLDIPLLFGAQTQLPSLFPPRETFGVSAILLLPGGKIGGHYLKERLFPFSEEIPLARYFPWLNRFHPRTFDTASAPSQKQFSLAINREETALLEVNICYEDLYPESFATEGVSLEVVILNDMWFSGMRTIAQHATLARLRALEFARPLLRESNTGKTLLANWKGEIVEEFPLEQEQAKIFEIPLARRDAKTFFGMTKDIHKVFAVLCAVLPHFMVAFSVGYFVRKESSLHEHGRAEREKYFIHESTPQIIFEIVDGDGIERIAAFRLRCARYLADCARIPRFIRRND